MSVRALGVIRLVVLLVICALVAAAPAYADGPVTRPNSELVLSTGWGGAVLIREAPSGAPVLYLVKADSERRVVPLPSGRYQLRWIAQGTERVVEIELGPRATTPVTSDSWSAPEPTPVSPLSTPRSWPYPLTIAARPLTLPRGMVRFAHRLVLSFDGDKWLVSSLANQLLPAIAWGITDRVELANGILRFQLLPAAARLTEPEIVLGIGLAGLGTSTDTGAQLLPTISLELKQQLAAHLAVWLGARYTMDVFLRGDRAPLSSAHVWAEPQLDVSRRLSVGVTLDYGRGEALTISSGGIVSRHLDEELGALIWVHGAISHYLEVSAGIGPEGVRRDGAHYAPVGNVRFGLQIYL